uniref:Uncharacterized protein n=1 Tax=Arundo donax TaxID=35708 RepID=A0A0A9GSE5_ARUDO
MEGEEWNVQSSESLRAKEPRMCRIYRSAGEDSRIWWGNREQY